ncbi:LacI family DNA-binding transcriptional regulator [Microbacterium sp. A82]|uniref:LacI family DNA-binding transcriptional regulator n=1 Tax=Microbacterium sp. A82 TaxID=3450452 RepID=UPI003F3AFB4D
MAVTRAQVALAAGVSPAVVSYVINGGPRPVSAHARERVEKAIAELDYRPNAVASALRRGSTRMIGLLTESPINPFFAELAEAIAKEATQNGLALTLGIVDIVGEKHVPFLKSVVDHRIDGVIAATDQYSQLASKVLGTVPVVSIQSTNSHVHGTSGEVSFDNEHAARITVEHLMEHGYTEIACIAGPWHSTSADGRIIGWRETLMSAGLRAGEDLVEHAEFSASGGRSATHTLLGPMPRHHSRSTRPRAIFISSDVQAIGVLQACAELGLRVPDDVALASIDGTDLALRLSPPLTSVRQPVDQMATKAIGALLASAEGLPIPTQIVRGTLIVGRSCGCTPAVQD